MSTATLAGHGVTKARITIPQWGAAWAEVSLGEEATLTGSVSLVVADLSLAMSVVAGGPSKGASSYHLVAGAGGWARTIPRKGYIDDGGVKAETVIRDAAQEAGETLAGDLPTTRLASSFVRPEGPAWDVLEQVAPRGWYVDETGATRIGRRPAVELVGEVAKGPPDLANGTVTVAAESLATMLPGITVDGLEAGDVEIAMPGARATLYGVGQAGDGAFDAALRTAILRLFPALRLPPPPWEYRVVTQDGERLNLQPVLSTLGLPDLRRAFVRPGLPGARADLALGSRVLVALVHGDRSRPVVVGYEDAEGAGFAPTRLDLSPADETGVTVADSIRRVVRYGDPIVFSAPGPGVVALPVPSPLSPVRA